MPAAGYLRRELVPMVTYSDLFTFVIMLCAVITLVLHINSRKKQRPQPGKLRRYFIEHFLPAARLYLAFGSLVKCIICHIHIFVNLKPPLRTGHQSTTEAETCSVDTRPKQAYCIIRSSQTQAEQTFLAGCYFYTHFSYIFMRE